MVSKLKSISSGMIILFTALALITAFLAGNLFSYISESSARKNGSLESYTISATDFVWNGIKEKNGQIITTDNDPQMILEKANKFSSVRFYMESTIYPGEMAAYYTQPGDQAFSVQKRLWIVPAEQQGWYLLETDMLDITALRIDPTMYAGNILTFGDFIFNREKSFGDYFAVSYVDIFNLLLYTGIISSVLKFLQEILKREID